MAGGTLTVSDNGRFLLHEDGPPFFYMGDTARRLLYKLDRTETDRYLEDRAAKGFNVIQMVVLDTRFGPNQDGEHAFHDHDVTRPNEKFFEHVDYVVERCAGLGMHVGMFLNWGYIVTGMIMGGREQVEPLVTMDNARTFGRFLGERYGEQPVIWVVGGDDEPRGKEAVFAEQARGIAEGDGGRGLITFHPHGSAERGLDLKIHSSTWFHEEDWLDFNMVQSGHKFGARNYEMIAHDWGLGPPKPVLDAEPSYENMPHNLKDGEHRMNDSDVRLGAYWALFAGACGHVYGCNEIFQFWNPGGEEPTFGARIPWRTALQLPGSFQMQFARRLMESRPYVGRIPDDSLVVAVDPAEHKGHVCGTRGSDGGYAFVCSTRGFSFTVDLGKLSGETLRAAWYNPRTGTVEVIGEFAAVGEETFAPPRIGHGYDWVLILDEVGRGFALPGAEIDSDAAAVLLDEAPGDGDSQARATDAADRRVDVDG